ncbi:29723_t:CDS:2, partial [Racocetra persica]
TEMDLSNKGLIGDLNLSAFPNLERLDVSNNRIARLGIRNNPKLKELVASNNKLKKIGLSNNGNLETLVLTSNQLTELKVSHLTKLKTLNCAINGLEELDLSNCHSLEGLYCYSNKLKGFLTLSHLSNLQYVYCYRNLLQAIDCTGLVKLKELYCARNPCELTLENCTSLEEIDYSEIAVNVILDLSGLVNLKRISVNHSMDATFFGLSDCKNLEFFSACNTFIVPHVHHFKKLDFSSSSLPKLKYLELCFNDDHILTEREKEAIAKLVKSNPNLKDFYLRDKNISFGSSFGREDDSFFPSLLQYFKNHKIKKISLKEDGSLVITKTKSGLQDDEPSEIIKNDEEIKKDTQ